MRPEHLDAVRALLKLRPELGVLAEGVTIGIGSAFDVPFRVTSGSEIELSPGVLRGGPALRIHLRHALELAIWHRLAPAPRPASTELAISALACWTALQYLSTLPVTEAAAALDALPAWMRHLHRFTSALQAEGDRTGVAAELVIVACCLLHLQCTAPVAVFFESEATGEAAEIIAELMDVARPAEVLLTCGADERVRPNPVSRTNKYGSTATPPPPLVAFSSCTTSSPSIVGYRAAEEERQRLLRASLAGLPIRAAFAARIEDARGGLAAAIGLDSSLDADVVLAASGTDCELHALQLALSGHRRDLISIVIGPDETGSGSTMAAGGRHFDAQSPLGGAVTVGRPVQEMAVDRVRVQTVPIRGRTGRPFPVERIDATVEALARRAVRHGARVLLHVLDGSKTGLQAPSIDAVRRLHDDLGDDLMVLIDAAQMRTPLDTLVNYVRAGWVVLVTGSKFFMGPPFSGALIVPRGVAARAGSGAAVAPGLAAYASAFDVPPSWAGWRAALPFTPNFGLLVRWRAALAEMEGFHAVRRDVRNERLGRLASTIDRELRTRSFVSLLPGTPDRGNRPWDVRHSIWAFVLRREGTGPSGSAVLDFDEAWQVFAMLNRDISRELPARATPAERELAAVRCHIGQPVRVAWADGSIAGALRIALGARSLQSAVEDPARVLDKLEVILRYRTEVTAREAVA